MLEIIIPRDRKKLERQIKALKYALKNDLNDKDKKVYTLKLWNV